MPASDITVTFCPPGPTNSTSTSFPKECVKFFKSTVTLLIVPVIPATLITDGYGAALPTDGIVIAVVFWKVCVAVVTGMTVNTKVSLTLVNPSLTLTVIVAVPF